MTKTCLFWEMCKAVKLTEDPISGKKIAFLQGEENIYPRKLKLFFCFFSTVTAVSYVYFAKEIRIEFLI